MMSKIVLDRSINPSALVDRAVSIAAKGWFVIAALGHWIFVAYILAVFYPPIAHFGLEGFKGMHLPAGFREGDALGNLASVSHILLAAIIIGGGPLQLIQAVRRHSPTFHRWLGRSYILAAVCSSIAGLYMTWTRSTINWETFTGPFLYVLGFAQYGVPLAMLEWYFYCQRQASPKVKIAFVTTLGVLTVYMVFGIFAATMGLWLPRM